MLGIERDLTYFGETDNLSDKRMAFSLQKPRPPMMKNTGYSGGVTGDGTLYHGYGPSYAQGGTAYYAMGHSDPSAGDIGPSHS